MNTGYYAEVKQWIEQVSGQFGELPEAEIQKETAELVQVCDQIKAAQKIGSSQGLLALEDFANSMDKEPYTWAPFFQALLMMVVDGVSWDSIEEYGLIHIWKEQYGLEKLKRILILRGMFGVQNGQSPRVIKEILISMLPDEVAGVYREVDARQDAASDKSIQELVQSIPDKKPKRRPSDPEYFVMELFEYMVSVLDAADFNRWMEKADHKDIELVLKTTSGAAKKRILEAFSERLAKVILDDMDEMGPVRLRDCKAAAVRLLELLVHLMEYMEVGYQGKDLLRSMLDLFQSDENPGWEDRSRLYALLKEYEAEKDRLAE
jgi:hypothetical protein